MGNISQKDLESLESILESSSTNIEKQMKEEYSYLKSSIQHQDSEITGEYPETKTIINPINPKRRLSRFYKWFKMILIEEEKSFASRTSHELSLNYPKEEVSIDKRLSTITKTAHNNVIHQTSNSISENINIICDNNLNRLSYLYEINLRKYYHQNTEHFFTRATKGPPDSLRWLVWMILIKTPYDRKEEAYKQFSTEEIEEKVDIQIKKDINRTFAEITLPIQSNKTNEEIECTLYRILKALAFCDKELGYCQGVNFITGYLLIVSNYNEIETFYMVIALFSKTFQSAFDIRGFYIDNFPMLNCFLYVFDKLLIKEAPELSKHLQIINIPYEAWIGKWIQTLYSLCLPYELNLRMWDHLLAFGVDYIIAFSISLVKVIEDDLLNIKDAFDYSDYFKSIFNTFSNYKIVVGHPYLKKEKKYVLLENILSTSRKIYKTYKKLIPQLRKEYDQINQCSKISLTYDLDIKIRTNSNQINNTNTNVLNSNLNQTIINISPMPQTKSQTTNISNASFAHSNSNSSNDNESKKIDEEAKDSCDERDGTEISKTISIQEYVFNINKKK